MTLKTKLKAALKSGPKNIRQLAIELYGEANPKTIDSTRMVIVRLRRDRVDIVTDKEITYELADFNPKPGKNKASRDTRKHDSPV